MVVLPVRGFKTHAQTQNKAEEKCSLKLHTRKLLHNRCEIKKVVPHLTCLCLTDSTLDTIAKKHHPIWRISKYKPKHFEGASWKINRMSTM